MKKIAVFFETKLLNFKRNKLGLEYFLKKKINIRIFNIGPIARPEAFKKYLPIERTKFPKEEVLVNEKHYVCLHDLRVIKIEPMR